MVFLSENVPVTKEVAGDTGNRNILLGDTGDIS
jgi:hypothetical protein